VSNDSFAEKLRQPIATAIAAQNANAVPGICTRFGMQAGETQEAFRSRYNYVKRRVDQLSSDTVAKLAYKVRREYPHEALNAVLFDAERPQQNLTRSKPYYSVRTGKNPQASALSLPYVLDHFKALYEDLENRGYFAEAFGYWCVDNNDVPGTLGEHLDSAFFIALRKKDLTPLRVRIPHYSEDDFFDVVEFLFDHCSKPFDGYFHSFSGCGMHWEEFDGELGRFAFRERINQILASYQDGYELSAEGEILVRADEDLSALLSASVPTADPENIGSRVAAAVAKFRRSRSSLDERHDAVRTLADVLEYLRPELKQVLNTKDEKALFDIANNFGIRHHNKGQQVDYDRPVWLSWMFYYYLATIHTATRLIEKKKPALTAATKG
jgi:hypothetical protein